MPDYKEKQLLYDDKPAGDELFKMRRESQKDDGRGIETLVSQESVIVSTNTAIVAFEGLNDQELFDKHRKEEKLTPVSRDEIWEMYQALNSPYYFHERIYKSDFEKLWKQATEMKDHPKFVEKFGPEVDIEHLTPYQAVYLAQLTVTEKIQYEYSLLGRDYFYMLDEKERTHLESLDDKSLNAFLATRKEQLDNMTAEELFEEGKGTCRHMAMAASATFEAIKTHQSTSESLLTNTYLLYHSPIGVFAESSSDEKHAYNLMIVLSKSEEQTGTEVLFSVADPTWGRDPEKDFDQTYRRLASVVAFVRRNGKNFGILEPVKESIELADNILERIDTLPSETRLMEDILATAKISSLENGDALRSKPFEFLLTHATKENLPTTLRKCFYLRGATTFYNDPAIRWLKWDCLPTFFEKLRDCDLSDDKNPDIKPLATRITDDFAIIANASTDEYLSNYLSGNFKYSLEGCLRAVTQRKDLAKPPIIQQINRSISMIEEGNIKIPSELTTLIEDYKREKSNGKVMDINP